MRTKRGTRTAVERVQARIRERLGSSTRPRKTQAELAQRLKISEPSLTELLNGKASRRGLLHHLDAIADYLGVPPSTLVVRSPAAIAELQAGEGRLLAHYRALPREIQGEILSVFEHFATLLPEEREARYWWSRIRRLKRSEDRAMLDRTLDDMLHGRHTDPANTDGTAAPGSTAATTQSTRRKTGSGGNAGPR